ncbi:hypothetical protein FQA39_LY18078 [Lamprigera yunnana]|nr:hypothetical protein FQA39_LY18078 [Lamprigera yunnana]
MPAKRKLASNLQPELKNDEKPSKSNKEEKFKDTEDVEALTKRGKGKRGAGPKDPPIKDGVKEEGIVEEDASGATGGPINKQKKNEKGVNKKQSKNIIQNADNVRVTRNQSKKAVDASK